MRHATHPAAKLVSLVVCSFALALSPLASPARGGEIVDLNWFSGVASVAADIIMAPPAPINDDQVGPSPNIVNVFQKNYFAIGPVDLVFDVVNTGRTTEYRINEGVSNSTGINWSGYHLELGFGIGAGFVQSTAGDGLDFDAPDNNSGVSFGAVFPSITVLEDDIFAGGGTLPAFAFGGGWGFHIDVPDGITEFTLRQSPVPVPEPASLVLLAVGAAALLRVRRRRG